MNGLGLRIAVVILSQVVVIFMPLARAAVFISTLSRTALYPRWFLNNRQYRKALRFQY